MPRPLREGSASMATHSGAVSPAGLSPHRDRAYVLANLQSFPPRCAAARRRRGRASGSAGGGTRQRTGYGSSRRLAPRKNALVLRDAGSWNDPDPLVAATLAGRLRAVPGTGRPQRCRTAPRFPASASGAQRYAERDRQDVGAERAGIRRVFACASRSTKPGYRVPSHQPDRPRRLRYRLNHGKYTPN